MSKNVLPLKIVMAYKILSKTKAKEIRSLSAKKARDEKALFIAEGEKSVIDLLGSFDVEAIICYQEWAERHSDLLHRFEPQVFISDKRGLEIISSLNSIPPVVAVFKKWGVSENIPLLEKDRIYLLLDEIQDPGNLGTIIRTCDWFGIYDIFASPETVDIYNPKVVQATMGSLSRVRVHYLNLEDLIRKNSEIPVIGTLLNGNPLNEFKKISSCFLLMGNEGRGISEKLKQLITIPLTIPPVNKNNHPDSLNVAIATAVVLSHIV
ncbi:MAG: RNA methyltransferase [Muribaculaceae bacterium]|nr:RNA methyltransferase [Muribaculaceae bacterium]